jgi:hypothetical protein
LDVGDLIFIYLEGVQVDWPLRPLVRVAGIVTYDKFTSRYIHHAAVEGLSQLVFCVPVI